MIAITTSSSMSVNAPVVAGVPLATCRFAAAMIASTEKSLLACKIDSVFSCPLKFAAASPG